jgi:biotin carboxyl carrier protein
VTQQYEIEVGGRVRRVAVARSGDRFDVTVDGRTIQVDAARIGGEMLSLIVTNQQSAISNQQSIDRSYEVVVAPDPATSQLIVSVGGLPVPVAVNGRRRRGGKDDHAGAGGPQRIAAPMPGKVVRVLVKPGDAVHARQPLVVVEAMKMENELRALREGIVADVPAREGQSVDAGALLVVVQ